MPEPVRNHSRYESLRGSRRSLRALAPAVQFGLLAIGLGLFLDRAGVLVSDVQLTWGERRVAGMIALVTLGGFGVGGWAAGRLLRALGELLGAVADQAEAATRTADLLEWHVVPALSRAALAMERSGAGLESTSTSASTPAADGRALAIAGVRQALDEARWERADRLIEALRRDFPGLAEADHLADELVDGRRAAIDDLRARLDAARSANDPERAIGYRDELTRHLRGEALKQLDRELIHWVMLLIQRRLRSGSMAKDVAELAARAADSFGDTTEGASLRAALPTLRRSAGLCPRCAQPYAGIDDACPDCRRAKARAIPETPPIELETPPTTRNGPLTGEEGP